MRKHIVKIKSILALLLGAYLCIFASPLGVEVVFRLPSHVDSGDWLTEFLYLTTPWAWIERILGGRNLFAQALTASSSTRVILILIVYGLLLGFLAALVLWFKKPWRWWSAATLIAMSFLMHWVHMWGLGWFPFGLLVVPITYILCFLGACLLRMEQHTPVPLAHRL